MRNTVLLYSKLPRPRGLFMAFHHFHLPRSPFVVIAFALGRRKIKKTFVRCKKKLRIANAAQIHRSLIPCEFYDSSAQHKSLTLFLVFLKGLWNGKSLLGKNFVRLKRKFVQGWNSAHGGFLVMKTINTTFFGIGKNSLMMSARVRLWLIEWEICRAERKLANLVAHTTRVFLMHFPITVGVSMSG